MRVLATIAVLIALLASPASAATSVIVNNGQDQAEGSTSDAACGGDALVCSVIAMLKRVAQNITGATIVLGQAVMANSVPVAIASNQSAVPVSGTVTAGLGAATTGGCTPYHLAGGTTASTNSNSIKGSAGTLCALTVINTTTTLYFFRTYDSASAPTCSSSTGVVHSYPIPPAAASGLAGGFAIPVGGAYGEAFANGIGYCVTANGTDNDNTNAATGIYINGSYK